MAFFKNLTAPRLIALAFIGASLALTGCVSYPPAPEATTPARFDAEQLIVTDGAVLGLTVHAAARPDAVVVAVHGMNDYANAFSPAAAYWASSASITTYAYDQRGFGRSPEVGRWVGADTLKADLRAALAAARSRHPSTPIFVIGHSMGAAVVIAAMADGRLPVAGAILIAPAVWGGSQLPLAYRISANLAASFAPGKTLTGARAGRQASDNIEVLRALGADPLVVKETRLDAVLGVVRLMGEAYGATDEVGGRLLVLHGDKDEIIPPRSIAKARERMCGSIETRSYPDGWHLLLRDLQAEIVWRDIADWIDGENAAGPEIGAAGPAALVC